MTFAPATRRHVPLLIGIAGPSGAGKTYSALRLAKGIAQGKPIAFVDTERGRALHYADEFGFLHSELDAPFTPARYGEKIAEAQALDPAVIVIDSFSHEWSGEGGVLDMQQAEYERMGSREAVKFASWIKPKGEHKALVNDVLLRLPCHLILCLRAEEKVDLVKNANGKLEVVPKRTLAGHVGWIPVTGKEIPYELTISLVVTPDAPGVPQAIKLQQQHRELVPLDRPLDENVGAALAAWAQGSGAEPQGASAPSSGDDPASASVESGAAPLPAGDSPGPEAAPATSGNTVSRSTRDKPITDALATKLGILIREVRDNAGAVTTADMYRKLSELRGVDLDVLGASIPGELRDADGVLHIGPALKTLTRAEGHALIDWLESMKVPA